MRWWTRVRAWTRRAFEKTFAENPAAWLVQMFGGRAAATGVWVTPATALQCTAVYACVRILAEGVASLPLKVYARLPGGGKAPAPEHPLYPLLHEQPNPEQTAFEFREMLQGHLALRGNAYAEIVRNRVTGVIAALWPIHPDAVRVERSGSGDLVYFVKIPDRLRPRLGVEELTLAAERVLHLRGLSSDGMLGLSPIQLAREAIGLTLAVEEYGARFFGNGAQPGGVIETPTTLTDKALQQFQTRWSAAHEGLSMAHRISILEGGMSWKSVGLQNDHAQFLQTRKFQIDDIARIFRVPPHMVGDLERATFSNIEHQAIEFVVHTLRPWLVRWEQALAAKLLTPRERAGFFIEHLVDALLRGDALARSQALQTQFQNGALTLDEWREIENRNPAAGGVGKVHYVPTTLAPVGAGMTPAAASMEPMESPGRSLVAAFVGDAATRAVRREVEAVRKAAVRDAQNGAAWRTWVDEFYARHAAYLAEILHVPLDAVRGYAEDHRAALLAHGVAAAEQWDGQAVRDLLGLVGAEWASGRSSSSW